MRSPEARREFFNAEWDKFRKVTKRRKVAFFLGAGTSQPNGLPSWKALVDQLAGKRASIFRKSDLSFEAKFEFLRGEHDSTEKWIAHLRNHLYAGFHAQAAAVGVAPMYFRKSSQQREPRLQKQALDFFKLRNPTLVNLVSACSLMVDRSPNYDGRGKVPKSEGRKESSEKGKEFVENPRIGAVLTTNVDSLIQLCDRACHRSRILRTHESADVAAHRHKIPLYQLHGYLFPWEGGTSGEAADRLIFTESEYLERNDNPHHWANITLHWALREFVVVFVGASMTDPLVRRALHRTYLERGHALWAKGKVESGEDPSHFAILKRGRGDEIRGASLAGLGVMPLWVDRFNEIPEGTAWMCDLLRRPES